MASSATTPSAQNTTSAKNTKIGYFVQLGGIVAFATGVVLSAHHVAIGVAFVGGVAAFYVGQKIRSIT